MIKELKQIAGIARWLGQEPELVVVYDENVAWVATEVLKALPQAKASIALETSEELKTMDTVLSLERRLLEAGLSRGAMLLAIGGGITTDLTGFAASMYKRGIRYANFPTTLLAQVDAAIGGKTGVNLDGYKNMLGAFRMPEYTFLCADVLRTLPPRAFRCGVAELLKTFLLADASAYESAIRLLSGAKMPQNAPEGTEIGNLGANSHSIAPEWQQLILRAAEIKAGIVERDPEEHGERAKLNLGHTFGHAIEHEAHKRGEDIQHGEAVAIGIILAAEMSDREGLSKGLATRLKADFAAAGLPTECPYPLETLHEAMTKDKKATVGKTRFILPKEIGSVCEWEVINN